MRPAVSHLDGIAPAPILTNDRLLPCFQLPQLLVRGVPEEVIEALKRRAAQQGRSAEAEHRIILENTLCAGRAGFWERAAALRAVTSGRISIPSEDLIRQDRDER